MKRSVELKGRLRNELALETKHPHVATPVFEQRTKAMDLASGDETDERRVDNNGMEIDKMLQLPFDADDQLFEIMCVRLEVATEYRFGFLNINFENGE
jgi:hypothetical protein